MIQEIAKAIMNSLPRFLRSFRPLWLMGPSKVVPVGSGPRNAPEPQNRPRGSARLALTLRMMNEPRRGIDAPGGRLRRPYLFATPAKKQDPEPDESDNHNHEAPVSGK